MIKTLLCLVTVTFLFIKYGEMNPRMMSLDGDIDFVMKNARYYMQDIVGYMYDDVNGGYSLNPSFCLPERRGEQAFETDRNCLVAAGHSTHFRPSLTRGSQITFERNFPAPSTGSNLFLALYDSNSPYTINFASGSKAFKFEDVNGAISADLSSIRCNNKDETYYDDLFGPDADIPGQINFIGNDVNQYDYILKCVAKLRSPRYQHYTTRAFMLTIENREYRPFAFPSAVLNKDLAMLEDHSQRRGDVGREITKVEPTFRSHFVFRATSTGECEGQVTMDVGEFSSSVLSFAYNGDTYSMPAIYADDILVCGIQQFQEQHFNYWCGCIQTA